MQNRSIRQSAAGLVFLVAVVGLALGGAVGCSSPEQGAPPVPPVPPAAPAAPGEQDAADQQGGAGSALAPAAQGAAALAALGALGQDQGDGQQVRDLGGQLSTEGQALLDGLQQGGAQAPAPTAEQQAVLDDLQARSGAQFDQAWLRAAMQAHEQAMAAANAVLSSPDASPEAQAAARASLARLDALAAQLNQAAGSSGAGTPGAVDAGDGGLLTGDITPAAAALVWTGVLLLGGALWWRRRAT